MKFPHKKYRVGANCDTKFNNNKIKYNADRKDFILHNTAPIHCKIRTKITI